MLYFLISLKSLVFSQVPGLLIYGPKTPSRLKSNFNNISSLFLSETENSIDFSSFDFPSLILDISLDPIFFPILDSISNYLKVPYLTITKTSDYQYSSNRFFILPPTSEEAEALILIINFFKWKKFAVLSSNNQDSLNILKILSDSFTESQMIKCIYEKNSTEEYLDLIIKKYVKAAGVKNLLVLDQGGSLETCVKILKFRKFDQFGNYLLFGLGNFYNWIEGSVELSYGVGNEVSSVEQFYTEVINYVLVKFTSFTLKEFKKICSKQICLQDFFVVNNKNGKKVVVGTVKESINIIEPILFPGNNSNIEGINFKKNLPIMIANGTSEPNNITNPKTSYTFNGAFYAAELENSEKDLEDFQYVFIPTDCGNLLYDLTWCMSCISKYKNNLGLAYITGFWSESSIANCLSLKTLKIFLPQISTSSGSGFMNNVTLFPEFLKMTGDPLEVVHSSLLMYKFFNWNKILLISGDGELNRLRYDSFVKVLDKMGITIVNPIEYQFFPDYYKRDDFEKYKHIFEYLRDTNCRIVYVLITFTKHFIEGLYDVGLRKGDVIIISSVKSLYSKDEENGLFQNKQLELLDRSLLISPPEFFSDYGKNIKKQLEKKYSPIINMCNTFDTFLVISNSIRYLIKKGEDFEDPWQLIQAMRSQRFKGCTGSVFFRHNENTRELQWSSYYQVVINTSTNRIDYNQFLALSKFSVLAVKLINEPMWPTGESTAPSNFRVSSKCVDSKQKQRSDYGLLVLHIFSIIFLIITIIVAFYSQKYFDDSIPELVYKSLPSSQDVIYQYCFICEFFQILSLDPANGSISKLSRDYNYLAGIDLITFFDIKNNEFWHFQKWLIGIVLMYSLIITLAIIAMKKITKIEKFLIIVIENALLLIGHIMYMPLILMFMNIYRCEEQVADNLTDSFLSRDCSENCYKGKHLIYAIISSISLVIFLIISTFLRPFWQTIQNSLRLRTKPKYLSILSISQVLLVLVKVNLEPYSMLLSGYFICGVILCLVLLTLKMKPFNYEKIMGYQICLLLMDCWAILFSTTFSYVSIGKFSFLVIVGGICIIYVFGLKIFGNSREVFVVDEPDMIPKLIKFQFSTDFNRIRPESNYRAVDESENCMLEFQPHNSSLND